MDNSGMGCAAYMDVPQARIPKKRRFFEFAWLIVACLVGACHSQRLMRLESIKPVLPALKTIQLEVTGNCVSSPRQRIDLIATSLSYSIQFRVLDGVEYAVLVADSDSDGVPDSQESEHEIDWCLNSKSGDTIRDNYSDWIVHFLKIPCDVQATLPEAERGDDDGDGLSNADEGLLRSDSKNWDTDGDAIADSLEARAQSNALVPNTGSWAGDDISDLEKIRMGLPYDRTVTEELSRFALRYKAEVAPSESGLCYRDTIENIPIVPTSESNEIALYRISSDGSDLDLEIRKLRAPADLADGSKIVVDWNELEVSQ